MLRILQAHGLDAGPTQRPLLAGAIGGVLAAIPALVLIAVFGALAEIAALVHSSLIAAALSYGAAMMIAGIFYGALFQRAANDARGCWLFGIAFGFLVWMVGLVPLLQWLPEQPTLTGRPAAGALLGQLMWGLVLGVIFPLIHRPLHAKLDDKMRGSRKSTGPEAAATPSRGPQVTSR